MLINRFNPSYLQSTTSLPPYNNSHHNTTPAGNYKTYTPSYTPASQPTNDNSKQFAFPEFQPKSFLRPITSSFLNFGNSLLGGLSAGLGGLRQAGPTMPAWNMPGISQVQQPQQLQQTSNVPAARPTVKQIFNSLGQGASQGLQDFSKMAKQHAPLMIGVGAGLASAGAVCPFMGGTLAATGGAMLAQNQGATGN